MSKVFINTLFIFVFLSSFSNLNSQSMWYKVYGDPYPRPDKIYNVLITKDNNILTVEGRNNGSQSITGLTKFDLNGNVIWHKDIGSAHSYTAVEDSVGNLYVLVGNGPWIYKLDFQGNILWSIEYNHPLISGWLACKISMDNKYLILTVTSTSGYRFNITKIDTSGGLIWSKNLYASDTLTNYHYNYKSLLVTNDSYYISGSKGFLNAFKPLIVKLDTSGTVIWDIDTFAVNNGGFGAMVQISEGTFIAEGGYCISGGGCALYCTKFSSNGSILWERGYIPNGVYTRGSILKTFNNRIVITGLDGNGYAPLAFLDTNGNVINNARHYVSTEAFAGYNFVQNTPDSGLVFAGEYSESGDEGLDCFIVKTDSNGNTVVLGINPVSNEVPEKFELYQNYPNPFNPVTKIKFAVPTQQNVTLSIYDVLGRLVKTLVNENLKAGVYEAEFDASGLASGMYFYSIEVRQAGSSTVSFTETKKMVLLK